MRHANRTLMSCRLRSTFIYPQSAFCLCAFVQKFLRSFLVLVTPPPLPLYPTPSRWFYSIRFQGLVFCDRPVSSTVLLSGVLFGPLLKPTFILLVASLSLFFLLPLSSFRVGTCQDHLFWNRGGTNPFPRLGAPNNGHSSLQQMFRSGSL